MILTVNTATKIAIKGSLDNFVISFKSTLINIIVIETGIAYVEIVPYNSVLTGTTFKFESIIPIMIIVSAGPKL